MEVQAKLGLGHRAGLRRVHALPRGARLHGALDGAHPSLARPLRELARASTRPPGQLVYGIVQGGVYEDLRAESAAYVAGAGAHGIAIGGSLGQDKEQMREVVGWCAARPARRAAAPPAGHRRRGRHRARGGRGLDSFDCATPTRLARHGTALVPDPERRWRLDLTKARQRARAASRSTRRCPCPACREHTRGYLHYLVRASELTAQAAAHPAQPDLHGGADARHARGDRRRGELAEQARGPPAAGLYHSAEAAFDN